MKKLLRLARRLRAHGLAAEAAAVERAIYVDRRPRPYVGAHNMGCRASWDPGGAPGLCPACFGHATRYAGWVGGERIEEAQLQLGREILLAAEAAIECQPAEMLETRLAAWKVAKVVNPWAPMRGRFEVALAVVSGEIGQALRGQHWNPAEVAGRVRRVSGG